MTEQQAIKKIKTANWYRQGGAIVPYFPSIPYRAAFHRFDGFNFFQGHNNYGYFNKDKERKFFENILRKQLKNNLYLKQKLLGPWTKLKKQKDNLLKKAIPKLLSQLSNHQLIQYHSGINRIMFNLWKVSICLESSDPWSDIILNQYLKKYGKGHIKPQQIALLCSPKKLSYLQQEKLNRIKVAIKLKQKKATKKDIIKHREKYNWMNTNWAGVNLLSLNYFKKQIYQMAKWPLAKLLKEKNKLLFWQKQHQKKVETLQKKLKLTKEIKVLCGLCSTFSDWREERKMDSMITLIALDKIINEFSKRTKLPKKLLLFLDGQEFTSMEAIKNKKNELQKRTKTCFYHVAKAGKLMVFTGKEALTLHQLLENSLTHSKTLTGATAYKGKIKGTAKLVVSAKDFKKIKRGDILVTQMTRPEFMPILHKVSAIVTDEGGITCHAAIMSRELKIPCVIGTQTATKMLKNGDLVEVDANQGAIKIIKK